jgi:hypothetical protein
VTTVAGSRTAPDPSAAADPSVARVLARAAAAALIARAGALGLAVSALACWPDGIADDEPPPLPAFIVSSFSPMIAEVATRCLTGAHDLAGPHRPVTAVGDASVETVTAIVVMSPLGDITSAEHVARAVADGTRIGPLLFFQAVPNAVAGLLAARWGLTGPMVSLGSADGGMDLAALFIEDGDATAALVILAETAPDRAVALLVTAREAAPDHRHDEGE